MILMFAWWRGDQNHVAGATPEYKVVDITNGLGEVFPDSEWLAGPAGSGSTTYTTYGFQRAAIAGTGNATVGGVSESRRIGALLVRRRCRLIRSVTTR
jgi:hypothetical protein